MDLKRYLGKIKNKIEKSKQEHETKEIKPNIIEEIEPEIVEEVDVNVRELFPESDTSNDEELNKKKKPDNTNFKPTITHETKTSFDEFIDERTLVSHNAFGNKEMKIKILEVSDELASLTTKFGDRIKINKIIVTIKHLQTQQIEEGEFDIESIERELIEKRHYTSTNRWVPTKDIRNGYVTNSRHTALISDAVALDYIAF
uniref:Uncharacterized protein n=1 Tax=uncultured marine thaumarchaeote KM3_64_C01 TaxID=1456221 RepID=A0A075HF10_9ARCH|nr:hypothetical protein [uncultured marine thaumarchaeote KM3_64_C01]